mgnify:CR=1 FL=1
MKNGYLEPHDRDAFLDFPPPAAPGPGKITCSKCSGRGGWNLRMNAHPYMMRGRTDTPENRHRYLHFKASCDNCNGWGTVPAEQGEHVHVWARHRNVGNCLNVYRCNACGAEQTVDSSD